jgi:hypothetical protein
MTSSWTAQLLLASPRSACSAAEPHPSSPGQGRWIFALGPCWVHATAVAHGHQRSPAVTDGSDEPPVMSLQLTQQRRSERAIQIVVPKITRPESAKDPHSHVDPNEGT